MEIVWNKIFENDESEIWHIIFKKMQLIKLIEIKNYQKKFAGCFILNLSYKNIQELTEYHFYSIDYFISNSLKRMCIQPHPDLDDSYLDDDENKINERIKLWFKNCKNKYCHDGIDVLGQSHGLYISETFKNLKKYSDLDIAHKEARQLEYDIKKSIQKKINSITDALITTFKLMKDPVLDLIIKSKKITIDEIFNDC